MELHLLRRAGRDEVRRMVFRRTGRGGAVPEASALQSLRRAWLQAHQDRQGPAKRDIVSLPRSLARSVPAASQDPQELAQFLQARVEDGAEADKQEVGREKW